MSLTPAFIRTHLDGLAKPPGSLGKLEDLAAELVRIQQTLTPQTQPRRLVLFAADHGVVAEGVTVWPSEITDKMVQTIRAGRAACSVLAQTSQTELVLVDVGTFGPSYPETTQFRCRKVASGSANLAHGPALTVELFRQALQVGEQEARLAVQDGSKLLLTGEMGIGNTTPAAVITALLTGCSIEAAVGPGAGANESSLVRKRLVVKQAVDRVRPLLSLDPEQALAAVSGLEIAAMAGFIREAGRLRVPLILDGFIATSAALIATTLDPTCREFLIAAHRSAEPGHRHALQKLRLTPFLSDWEMRLGEGTGALVLLPLLDQAAAILHGMARLSDLGTLLS